MTELEEIKNKIDIVEYIGKYVQLKQAGRNFKGVCPFHNEKTPSFMVSTDKQIFHCFGCNEGGDVIAFAQKIEGIDFMTAVRELADQAGVRLTNDFRAPKEPTDKLFEINEYACAYYEKELQKPENKQALEYLKSRGLEDKTIKEFRLGFAPARGSNLLTELTQIGFISQDMENAGIAKMRNGRLSDQFFGRLMFPISNPSGKVVAFTARVLDDSLPKYINTPETKIFHKSDILFGYDKAKDSIRKQKHAIIVEGQMDVIFSHQAGIKNVIASSGTALTESQLNIIKRQTTNIKLAFDVDMAGQNATKRAIELALAKDFDIKIIAVPEGKDPADLVKSDPKKWILACREAKNVLDYVFDSTFLKYPNYKNNLIAKKQATKEILAVIQKVESPTDRASMIRRLSEEMDVEEMYFKDALSSTNSSSKKPSQKEGAKTEIKSKTFTVEEHVLSLLLMLPNRAEFFFKRIGPDDFTDPELIRLVGSIKAKFEKDYEFDSNKWHDSLDPKDQMYINKLHLYIENLLGEANEELVGEDFFYSVQKIKKASIDREKRDLRNQIKNAERNNDKALANKLLENLNELINKKEKNL
jgi:DNA primase